MTVSPPPLMLASTSKYRQSLLQRLGVPFTAIAPPFDEESLKGVGLPPIDLAQTLSRHKAESVAALHPDAVVIGSDQLVALDDRILGKPGSAAAACDQLALLAGRQHLLVTAVTVVHAKGCEAFVDVTTLTMRALDPAAIARYVAADQPLDCAGAYKLESRGITLFSGIESADHTAIIGLPLIALTTCLRHLGYPIP